MELGNEENTEDSEALNALSIPHKLPMGSLATPQTLPLSVYVT